MSGKPFADGDGFFGVLDEPVPPHESTHRSHDSIADFLSVHDDLDIVGEETLELMEETARPLVDVVGVEGAMLVGDPQLVVIVQVVGCGDDADETTEVVLSDPDDFFLAAHPPVIVPVAPGSLAHCEAILENPGEVPGGDSQSPLSS